MWLKMTDRSSGQAVTALIKRVVVEDLWKLAVNILSVSKSHKNDDIIFNDDANAIITAADPVCRFVSHHFF